MATSDGTVMAALGTKPKRTRRSRAQRVETALDQVTRALAPLAPEAQVRVLRTVAAFFDIRVAP
jgi:hypothetical protein